MDWIRLVESKIRHLVLNLEKIQHISLAHISPESYPQTSETEVIFSNLFVLYFFIKIFNF